jgi:hypothetical protein
MNYKNTDWYCKNIFTFAAFAVGASEAINEQNPRERKCAAAGNRTWGLPVCQSSILPIITIIVLHTCICMCWVIKCIADGCACAMKLKCPQCIMINSLIITKLVVTSWFLLRRYIYIGSPMVFHNIYVTT